MDKRYSKNDSALANFFQVLVMILCAAIFIFGIASLGSLFEPKCAYEKVDLDFAVGEIVSDSTGSGVVGNCATALYSKEAVDCTGFMITTDFNTRVDYEVHFYAADKTYIGYVTRSDVQYVVDINKMPVLKDYVGCIDSDEYKAASAVLDDDDNAITAASIRIVIRPMGADNDVFSGIPGWVNKRNYTNGIVLKATTKVAPAQ